MLLKFLDFFSGIGGFRLGMEMAGHECVGHCEKDKFASKSYVAMHNPKESEWYANDITRVEPGKLPEADCYCFGFPCQSFSVAGKRGGFEDTRGTLFFEVMRLAKVRKPKYLFAENVAGLLSHDGGKTFGTILSVMGELGYDVQYQVLNSKNFGVPQNRERVFIVGHLRRRSRPKVFPITTAGKENINSVRTINTKNSKGLEPPQQDRIYNQDGIMTALSSQLNGRYNVVLADSGQGRKWREQDFLSALRVGGDTQCIKITEATKQGYDIAHEGDSINLAVPGSQTRRGRVGKGIANTLDTGCQQGTLAQGRIRRLTPRECFRLQGFPDEYFERAAKVNSDSQLYKQAGNSVTVPVIYEIAKRLD